MSTATQPNLRQVLQFLGKSGIFFLVGLLAFTAAYFTGHGLFAFLIALCLIPVAIILLYRALKRLKGYGLWSVRNRLLAVYALMGLLPIFFVVLLIGLGAWAMTNELANYLASSALTRHIQSAHYAVDALEHVAPQQRYAAAAEIANSFRRTLPGFRLYYKDEQGVHGYPAGSPDLQIPSGWNDVTGLLVLDGQFYSWSHASQDGREFIGLAPLTDTQVEELVPNFGAISLFESPNDGHSGGTDAAAGSFRIKENRDTRDFMLAANTAPSSVRPGGRVHLPPAAFSLDIPVLWPSTIPHAHIDQPNKNFGGVLWIYSRPSAVLGTFFSGTEVLRGVLFDAVVAVAIIFLVVELIAVLIGVRLARHLTGAIDALYEGTRRVTRGDFGHRIPVRSQDQLGELGHSFNQMTGNLQRLLVVEKEKERLQTEIEIAREVQAQLYPKDLPPAWGLKLNVRCDPARMVSGDYYDYEELGAGRLAFAIGDVAGKGISAALLMATMQASLRAQITQFQPLAETDCTNLPQIDVANLVSSLNKQIYAHTSPEKYATFFFGLFDQKTRTLTYTNAGHLAPLLIRESGVVPLETNGTVIGAFPFSEYSESCLTIEKGDLLICYTDGITEPENAYGEEFGEMRLVDLVRKHAHRDDHEIVQIVFDAVRGWTGNPELHDDMTLLLARQIQPA